MFIAKLSLISAGTTFKSGKVADKDTYILDVLSGKCPKNRFMAPAIAFNQGMVEGEAYLMDYTKSEDPNYPYSFNFKALKKLTFSELLEAKDKFGDAKILETVTSEVKEPTTH